MTRPTLAQLQAAMRLGGEMVRPPAFMSKTPRAPSTKPRKHEEHDSQAEVVAYLRRCCPQVLVAASLNGELWPAQKFMEKGRYFGWINKLKGRGMLTGDTDLRLTWFPSRCIFIEMKKLKGGVVSDAQTDVGKQLERQGFKVYVLEDGIDGLKEIIRAEKIPCLDTSLFLP